MPRSYIPPIVSRIQGCEFVASPYRGGMFQRLPNEIVLHCPAHLESCIEYLIKPTDGRVVSAHFVRCFGGRYVQMVETNRIAWHCRAKGMNHRSIGVEISGNHKRVRDKKERDELIDLLRAIVGSIPSIVKISQHSDHDPMRRDAGLTDEQMGIIREAVF